jgi:hypothetical protein
LTKDECEDALIKLGTAEEVAVAVLEVLSLYGPYEVKLKAACVGTLYVTVSCLYQGKFAVSTERIAA